MTASIVKRPQGPHPRRVAQIVKGGEYVLAERRNSAASQAPSGLESIGKSFEHSKEDGQRLVVVFAVVEITGVIADRALVRSALALNATIASTNLAGVEERKARAQCRNGLLEVNSSPTFGQPI